MPPEPFKHSPTPDYLQQQQTVSSRVNVSLLLDLRKRKWSNWDEMLESPSEWIEPFMDDKEINGGNNGYTDDDTPTRNGGEHHNEDELFHKEMEVEECRTDETRVMTKLRRGVLDIGPTMSRLRSNTFSSCCLERLVVMQCSCGEVVKREAYGTHHRMKHSMRGSAPGSPTTSNGSVPHSPLTLQPPPLSKLVAGVPLKIPPPQVIQKISSPQFASPLNNQTTNNNIEEKKPRVTPPSQLGAQDWKVLSSSEGGGTKLRIVRVNPSQSSTTPTPPNTTRESLEKTEEVNPMMQPLPSVCTVTPSPSESEERIISPRDRRAAHREEVRQVRPPPIKRIRLSTPPSIAREEETTTSLPSKVARPHHPTTVHQSVPRRHSYTSEPIPRPSSDHLPSSSSSIHPSSHSPLLISSSNNRYNLHSPSSSHMGGHPPPVQQRPSPALTYTNEHGQKVYLMSRGATQIKRPMPIHQQQPIQGEGMGYGGNGGGQPVNQGQRQTIVIVLPPGARNRNGPIVLPPGTTLRAIPSGQSSSNHHGASQTIHSGIGPNGQPVHYISHTPLPPSTRRMEMPVGTTVYPHPRLISTQPLPSSSHSNHNQPQSSYHVQQQQQQHHMISSSTVPSYQYQMGQQGDGYHPGSHSEPMGSRVVMGGPPTYGMQRAMNPGMHRVIEQRRLVETPSPPPTLQRMPVLRAQLFDEGTKPMRTAKKSASPSIVSSSTLDSPSQQPSSSTGFNNERGKSALMEMLSQDDSPRDGISHEEVVSTGDEDDDEMMPVLECHSTFNEEIDQLERDEEEEMPDSLEGCDSSTVFSTIPSSSTM